MLNPVGVPLELIFGENSGTYRTVTVESHLHPSQIDSQGGKPSISCRPGLTRYVLTYTPGLHARDMGFPFLWDAGWRR